MFHGIVVKPCPQIINSENLSRENIRRYHKSEQFVSNFCIVSEIYVHSYDTIKNFSIYFLKTREVFCSMKTVMGTEHHLGGGGFKNSPNQTLFFSLTSKNSWENTISCHFENWITVWRTKGNPFWISDLEISGWKYLTLAKSVSLK